MIYEVTIPWSMVATKAFTLNMNQYRNAHYHTLSDAKLLFNRECEHLINHIPLLDSCSITYTLFPPRRCDLNNVLAVVDKFFLDSLVNHKKLLDDSIFEVYKTTNIYGNVDKLNPRIEVLIDGVTNMAMNISLNEQDITVAILKFVKDEYGVTFNDANPAHIVFKSGRKGNGPSATVVVGEHPKAVVNTAPTVKKEDVAEATKTEPVSETTPVVEVEPVAQDSSEPVAQTQEVPVQKPSLFGNLK